MRTHLSWFIPLLGLLRASAAFACGEWTLQDDERRQSVRFYIRSTFLETTAGVTARSPARRILLMEGGTAEQLHTEAGGRPQLTVVDDRLQLHGRTVGALHGDTLTIGRASYRISVTLNQEAIPHPERREGRWLVEVRRDAQSVAQGRAMAMCLGGLQLPGDDVQVLEIRRRVTFYLAWRELLALGQPAKKLPASGRLAPN